MDEKVTLIAEKSHIVVFEGVVLVSTIAVLLSTSPSTAWVVVEIRFDESSKVWLEFVDMLAENSSKYCWSSSLRTSLTQCWNEGFIWKENIELNLRRGKTRRKYYFKSTSIFKCLALFCSDFWSEIQLFDNMQPWWKYPMSTNVPLSGDRAGAGETKVTQCPNVLSAQSQLVVVCAHTGTA